MKFISILLLISLLITISTALPNVRNLVYFSSGIRPTPDALDTVFREKRQHGFGGFENRFNDNRQEREHGRVKALNREHELDFVPFHPSG
ncbi:unnamed protein product [Bursaphelenchus okinawaensis]|uniref:Uncharacterized protein n=1 Tax=Bursaphelenchus okinawaensis TaxID=465554 RepID=A0A811LJI2_9BILA|nr:unnamed protein product [Bursaphelenchus okinawaensis]CAG9123597.1 unnamed protein product [Bursaphelenchus okinawaensis]